MFPDEDDRGYRDLEIAGAPVTVIGRPLPTASRSVSTVQRGEVYVEGARTAPAGRFIVPAERCRPGRSRQGGGAAPELHRGAGCDSQNRGTSKDDSSPERAHDG